MYWDYYMAEQTKIATIQMMKQIIDSKLQNFDWETNPQWQSEFYEIMNLIKIYWKDYLKQSVSK